MCQQLRADVHGRGFKGYRHTGSRHGGPVRESRQPGRLHTQGGQDRQGRKERWVVLLEMLEIVVKDFVLDFNYKK